MQQSHGGEELIYRYISCAFPSEDLSSIYFTCVGDAFTEYVLGKTAGFDIACVEWLFAPSMSWARAGDGQG